MIITTGRVRDGTVQIEPRSLPEGTEVTILAMEGDETFQLEPEDKRKLLAALAELDRGESVDASELLKEIRGS
jgi:hypothetical protein